VNGSESHAAYGRQATASQRTGFDAQMATITPVILASQATPDYGVLVGSAGGYSTTLQFFCKGLPAAASCQFGTLSMPLGDNQIVQNSLFINTTSAISPGHYSFTVVITDGFVTANLPGTFNVGDFTMSILPSSRTIGTSDYTNFTLSIQGSFGYARAVTVAVSCDQLPSGVSCPQYLSGFQIPNSPAIYFQMASQNSTPGKYTFAITGTVGSIVRSASAQLIISGGTFTGNVSLSTATISVGGSQNFNVQVSSVNNFQGQVGLSCAAPLGINCQFATNPVSISPGIPGASVLTISVSAKPSMAFPHGNRSERKPPGILSPFLIGLAALSSLLVMLRLGRDMSLKARRVRLAASTIQIVLLFSAFGIFGCGAGGSGAPVVGGNNGGGGGGNGASQVTVQGIVGGTTINLGTISVTVP